MKTVLITGSSRGIGKAMAQEFARLGYAVAVNYYKSEKEAKKLAAEIMTKYKVPCGAYFADVKNRQQVAEMVKSVKSELGTIEVLVNNAGISTQKLFGDISQDEWQQMINTHINGAYNFTSEVLPQMLCNHKGKIINISSMWGVTGGSCEVHYSTAKAGLIGFTKSLAKEVAPNGINVNCICPGVIKTDMLNIFNEETLKALENEIPLKRLGTPEDVAKAAAFLASEEASYITGTVLNINGGYVM
jgi:3-oxoacyl-[acyl-carrier protein] reductase